MPGLGRISHRLGQRLNVLRGRARTSARQARKNLKRPLNRLQPKGNPRLGQVEFPLSRAASFNISKTGAPPDRPTMLTNSPAGDLLADFFQDAPPVSPRDLLADFFQDNLPGPEIQLRSTVAAYSTRRDFDLPQDLVDLGLALPAPGGRPVQRFETPSGRQFVSREMPAAAPPSAPSDQHEFQLDPESPAYFSMLDQETVPLAEGPQSVGDALRQQRPFTAVNNPVNPVEPRVVGASPFDDLEEDPEPTGAVLRPVTRPGTALGAQAHELFAEPTYDPNKRGLRRRGGPRRQGIRFRNPAVALGAAIISAVMLLVIVSLIIYLTAFARKAPLEKFVVHFNQFADGASYNYSNAQGQSWARNFGANLLGTGNLTDLELVYSTDNISSPATAQQLARQRQDDVLVWGYRDPATNRLYITLTLQPNGPFDPPVGRGRQLVDRYLFDPEQVTFLTALPGEANPDRLPLAQFLAAINAYYTGNYDAAIAGLTQLLNNGQPENEPGLRLLRGNALFLFGKYAEAVEDYNQLININQAAQAKSLPIPVLPAVVHNNRGVALNFQGNYPAANQSFDLALKNSDKLPKIFANYAQFLLDRTDAEFRPPVLTDFKDRLFSAQKLDAKSAAVHQNLGRINYYQADYAEAINNLSTARELDPNYLEIYYWQGLAYLGKNDQARDIKTLNSAMEAFRAGESRVSQQQSQNRQRWQNLDQNGNKTLAAVWDARARDNQLELERLRFGIARTFLEMTRVQGKDLGNPLDRMVRWVKGEKLAYEEAGPRLKEITEPKPNDPDANFHYGPNNPEANFYYGQYLELTGEGDPQPYYRKAKDLEKDLNRRFRYHDILAKRYADQDKKQEALNEYIEFINLDKNRAQGYLALSAIEFRFGLFKEAAVAADAAIKIAPNDANAYLAAGAAQEGNLQLQQAINYFDRALVLNPHLGEAHLQKGLSLFNLNRRQEALASFSQALKLNPNYALAHFYAGIIYHETQIDLKSAIAEWEKAVKINPGYAEAWVKLGLVYSQLNRIDQAIEAYNKALASNAKDGLTHYYLALLYEGKNTKDDLARAETHFRRAIELVPGMVNAYNHLATVLVRQGGKADDALQLAQNAAKLDAKNPEAQVVLGDLRRGRGEFDPAIAAYNSALGLRKDYPEALFGRAAANLGKQQYNPALADVTRAIQLKPNWSDAFLLKGQVHEAMGQFDAANQSFELARKNNPDNPYLYAEMGNLAAKRQDIAGAIAAYEKSLSLFEPNPDAHFRLAQLYFSQRQFDSAVKQFQRVQQLDGQWPRTNYWIGRSFAFLNKANEAQAALEKTVQQEPNFVEGHFELGNVYRAQGKRDLALNQYDEALKLQPAFGPAWLNKGQVYEELVNLPQARQAYEKALASPDPQVKDAANNALRKLGVK
jgi:tetratricopeptide (TPR) repeat protein